MAGDNRTGDTGAEASAPDLRFVTRHVTDEESAAVTAVILSALEEAAAAETAVEVGRDPWVQSGRTLRMPLAVGPGSWRRSAR